MSAARGQQLVALCRNASGSIVIKSKAGGLYHNGDLLLLTPIIVVHCCPEVTFDLPNWLSP
jgi:hypothetical protein